MSLMKRLKVAKQKDPNREGPRATGTLKQLGDARKVLIVGNVDAHSLTAILYNHLDVETTIYSDSGRNDQGYDFVLAFHDFIPNSKTVLPIVLEAIKENVPCMVVKYGNTIDRDVVIK